MEHLPSARHMLSTQMPYLAQSRLQPLTAGTKPRARVQTSQGGGEPRQQSPGSEGHCASPPPLTRSDLLRPAPSLGLPLRQENTSDGSLVNYLGEGVIRLNRKPLPSFSLQARLKAPAKPVHLLPSCSSPFSSPCRDERRPQVLLAATLLLGCPLLSKQKHAETHHPACHFKTTFTGTKGWAYVLMEQKGNE